MRVQVSILMCLIMIKKILVFVDLACIPPSIRTAGVPGPARKKNALCAVGEGISASLALSPKVPKELNRPLPCLLLGLHYSKTL
jgi:hypothetical protein